MSLLGLVAARGGSKRIRNKNVVDFFGRPIIAYTLDAMAKAGIYDEIHVSTDDPQIREVVERLGFKVPFMRTEFSGDHDGVLDVGGWVLSEYQNRGVSFDDIGFMMACSPMIEPDDLRRGYENFRSCGRRPQLAVAEYPAPPQQALLLEGSDIRPERLDCFLARSQDLPHAVFDTGAFAFFSAADVTSRAAYRFENYVGFPISREKAVDINTPEDLAFAGLLFAGRQALSGG